MKTPLLTIVVPLFNESAVIEQFFREVTAVLNTLDVSSEVVLVNDGSLDDTWEKLNKLSADNISIQLINLSRNFGKESATAAGLANAKGDAVIVMDADLQDPPTLIPEMVQAWKNGADVVNMERSNRQQDPLIKRWCASLFYRCINKMSDSPVHKNVGDFRLLSRRVIDVLKQLDEKDKFWKGLMSWPGFKQTTLHYQRPERAAGESKWSFMSLLHFAIDGIVSFSSKPLRWAFLSCLIAALLTLPLSLAYGFFTREELASTSTFLLLAVSVVNLITSGLIAEYVSATFREVKGRPTFLVMEHVQKLSHVATQLPITDKRLRQCN